MFFGLFGGAVFNKLASDGIAVYSYDAFSFGRSEPNDDKRGHIEDFMLFVSIPTCITLIC
jgi:alpha-beta hydrolase superfamily lysophospholipase